MTSLIADWVGKNVSKTLKVGGIATAVTIKGTLVNSDESGALLQLAKGRTYVSAASILHMSLLNQK